LSLERSRFPQPIQKLLVEAGATKPVYRLDVPKGSVAFIWLVANNPMPVGASAEWIVDDELVELPDLKIKTPITRQLAPFEKPLKINPPIVAKKHVLWMVQSPVNYEYVVGLDGEIYTALLPEQVVARALTESLEAMSFKPKKLTAYPLEWKNQTVDGQWEICDVKGSGKLHELLILTTTSNFTLLLEVDGKRTEKTYTQYSEESEYVDEIVAIQSNGNYRIHLSDVPFSKNLYVVVKGTLTLSRVYLKYDLETT